MKISLMGQGDRSVGIPDPEMTIDFHCEIDDDERESIREMSEHYAAGVFGSKAWGFFDDECGDCSSRIVQGKCSLRTCINNIVQETN